jgi:alpha,alpha-trehalose phosphorylase
MTKKRVYELSGYSLDNRRLLLNETLFHNANGYIGVRYIFEEGYPEGIKTIPGQYINGFYDTLKISQAENLYGLIREKQTMLNVVDTQMIRVSLDGEEFGMFSGTLLDSRLSVDMNRGVTERKVLWVRLSGKRSASRLPDGFVLPAPAVYDSVRA